mgnify:CR=1 FL=1
MQTMTKRFYKTHSAIQHPAILMLYSEAIANATKCIEDDKEDTYYIVEVVAVVKRAAFPVIVEEIRK